MAKRYDALHREVRTHAGRRRSSRPLRPTDLPTTVVYPFGGGDLASALVTYPDARDITTISLEHAGDPTRLAQARQDEAARRRCRNYRDAIDGLLSLHDSTSENMRKLEVGGIPGQLSFHITGMTAMGYEPVSLKFFTINDDGTLHYLTQAEIDALAKKTAKKIKGGWVDTDFSQAFTNMELTFRKAGDPKAPLVMHRHIACEPRRQGVQGLGAREVPARQGQGRGDDEGRELPDLGRRLLRHPRLPAREHGVDGVGLDRHRAAQGEEGRLHADHVRHVHRRVSRGGRTRTSSEAMVEAVEDAAEPQAAVPLRLSGYRASTCT